MEESPADLTSSRSSPSSAALPDTLARSLDLDGTGALRPILPRLRSTPTTSHSGSSSKERQAKRPRTNVTVACDRCKQARAKCDGESPCQRCLKRNLPCRYDLGTDRRQIRGSVEEVQVLHERLAQYQRLVMALRSSSEDEAKILVQQLRPSHAPEAEEPPVSTRYDPDIAASTLTRQSGTDSPMPTNREELAALATWIKRDLENTLTISRAFTAKEPSTDQGYNDPEADEPP